MPEAVNFVVAGVVIVLLAVFGPDVRKTGLRGLTVLAMMSALSAAGSAALVGVQGLQPSSFIVMMCGIALGPGAGTLCGAATALLARLMDGGLGPWALWQAMLWCLMGATAGLTRKLPFWAQASIGFLWGFVFGWVTNLWWYTLGNPFTWLVYLGACVSSFSSDLTHAATNFTLLLLFGRRVRALFHRFGGIPDGV